MEEGQNFFLKKKKDFSRGKILILKGLYFNKRKKERK
jgi:hypothetical protein